MKPRNFDAEREPLQSLRAALQQTAQALNAARPSAAQERATLAAMRAARAAAPGAMAMGWRGGWSRVLAWSGVACSGAVLLAAAALLTLEPPVREAGRPLVAAASGFLPVVSTERWAGYLRDARTAEQAAQAWIVSAEMPRERLALLGLPYDPAKAGERVRAELLLHPSGDLLAVRFVP